ncbi:hypothetical protein GE21DRAFT_6886 [Neurospora crassa]|uniref:Uncharacterized protein n=2 Tax=Neurospora crassa TaxID=5141 RepID=Q1K647_NEUCR|nr:hypothetical protein NCU07770 [Neurospora crassa OR74A]EAA29028.1 hypothetical protein NCU07770 [Neurospora crassa OR74A]KHE85043.1 hypothetical protein GE21DRAFT_6886 [Neurospora crassa]CAD11785.1 hypothetical protein [Neurospora crassa]|eukprot:XP_958264.1 hypothetical protein NCU07770 [Neurospora crassa OR74A]
MKHIGKDNNLLSQEELLCYRPISQACHAYCKAAGLDQDLVVAVTTIIIFFRGGYFGGGLFKGDMHLNLERQGVHGGGGDVQGEGEGEEKGGDGEGGKGGYMDVLYSESDGDRDGYGDSGNEKDTCTSNEK